MKGFFLKLFLAAVLFSTAQNPIQYKRLLQGNTQNPVELSDPDAEAFFARLVDPEPAATKKLITEFIVNLKIFNGMELNKVGVLATMFDYMYFMGGVLSTENNARLNVVSASYSLAYGNTGNPPTWATTGYTGGAGKYLKNGYIDNTNASAFSLTGGFMVMKTRTGGVQGVDEIEAGNWYDDNNGVSTFMASRRGDYLSYIINNQSNQNVSASYTDSSGIGIYSSARIGTRVRGFKNKEYVTEYIATAASMALCENYFLAAHYYCSTPLRYSGKELQFAAKGNSNYVDQNNLQYNLERLYSGAKTKYKQPLGYIFNTDFTSISSAYVITGSGISSDGVKLTGTNASSTWTNYISYTPAGYRSNLERFTLSAKYSVGALDGEGVALALDGTNNSLKAKLFLTGADAGKVKLFKDNGVNALATSTAITLNAGDSILCTIRGHKDRINVTYINTVTPGTITVEYYYSLFYPISSLFPCHFKPSIYFTGGTQYVTSFSFYSPAEKRASMIVGDSNSKGLFAEYNGNRFYESSHVGRVYNVYSGSGNLTGQHDVNEVLALNPDTLYYWCGTNDVYNAVDTATSYTNIYNFITPIKNAGTKVIICNLPPLFPESTTTVAMFNAMLNTRFSSTYTIKDINTPLSGGGTGGWNAAYSLDFIHINAAGHRLVRTLFP